jgi:hypothetical protein
MKKMKKINFILICISVMFFSCENYIDVNTSPNQLSFDKVAPDKVLPAAQVGTYRTQAITLNQLGSVFSNAWAANVASFTGGYARELQLNIDNSFYTAIWDNLFLNVGVYQKVIDFPNESGKYNNSQAVARIMKAFYMQHIVDLYGDAPYDQAFKGLANTTPKYDDDQKIYRNLLTLLDEARNLIDIANPNAEDIEGYDVILRGDMNRWRSFANTLELRLLLRMSNSTGAVAAFRDSRLAKLSGATFITEDVRINPGYTSSNDDQLNPFYGNFATNSAGDATTNLTFVCPSGHAYKCLRAYSDYPTAASKEIIPGSGVNYPDVADPRATRIFRNGASQTVPRAVTQGSDIVDVYPPTATAGLPGRIGFGLFNPNNQFPNPITSLLQFAGNDGYIMTASESYFLQSEAALRNYPGFSGGDSLFDLGITSSMVFHNATVGSYITTINTKPNFGWIGTDTEKLHAIMYQKWLALIGVNAIQSFIDYNRTGFPLTPLSTSATQSRKPRRLIYPTSEYVANSANVPNISQAQIFADKDPSHPFWMLGDPPLGN